MLAVTTTEIGGDGWESNPPRTPQQRPANGFEDRGLTSTTIHGGALSFDPEQRESTIVRPRPRPTARLAVMLAVAGARTTGLFKDRDWTSAEDQALMDHPSVPSQVPPQLVARR